MTSDSRADRIVWMDLEMTGLDSERERIIEIAVLVTDSDLNVVAEGPELVVHQSNELLDGMDEWNTSHHGESGLTERVRASTLSEEDAQTLVLEFLEKECVQGKAPLAGNSIWQDRRFLARYMKRIDAFLHYRIIDVSSVKELARRWYPDSLAGAPAKRGAHRALDDVLESIEELRFYREHVFRAPQPKESRA
jgi:oligoribonuclease